MNFKSVMLLKAYEINRYKFGRILSVPGTQNDFAKETDIVRIILMYYLHNVEMIAHGIRYQKPGGKHKTT